MTFLQCPPENGREFSFLFLGGFQLFTPLVNSCNSALMPCPPTKDQMMGVPPFTPPFPQGIAQHTHAYLNIRILFSLPATASPLWHIPSFLLSRPMFSFSLASCPLKYYQLENQSLRSLFSRPDDSPSLHPNSSGLTSNGGSIKRSLSSPSFSQCNSPDYIFLFFND